MNRRLAQGFTPEGTPSARGPLEAVVALGANLGDREQTLAEAISELAKMPLVDSVRASDAMESVAVKPAGPDASAPAYLNAVAIITTRLAPSVLLAYLHAIEAHHGRERRERWGDRTLDLDLIAYGEVQSDTVELTLPHPRAAEREFVLAPWLSLDPDAEIPGVGRVADLLAQVRENS